MPVWSDYVATARERGALALEFYCVVSEPAGDTQLIRDTLPDHLAYQSRLEAENALVFAGPLSDETGKLMEGMGMIILRARDMDEARSLAEADPMHGRGARRFTLRRWLVNEGGITLTVKLSGQSVTLA